jgi:hypothetical protein
LYNSDFNISAPLSHPRRELGSNTPLKLACRWAQRCVGAALPPLCSGSILWTLSRPRDVAMPPLTLSALLRGQEAQGLSSVTSHSAHSAKHLRKEILNTPAHLSMSLFIIHFPAGKIGTQRPRMSPRHKPEVGFESPPPGSKILAPLALVSKAVLFAGDPSYNAADHS